MGDTGECGFEVEEPRGAFSALHRDALHCLINVDDVGEHGASGDESRLFPRNDLRQWFYDADEYCVGQDPVQRVGDIKRPGIAGVVADAVGRMRAGAFGEEDHSAFIEGVQECHVKFGVTGAFLRKFLKSFPHNVLREWAQSPPCFE